MSADLAARLRTLVQDYADGRLSLATYRKLRAPLIDSLELPGSSAPSVADDDITRPRAVARAADSSSAPATAPESPAPRSKRNLIVTIAVLGVALAAGAAIFFKPGGQDGDAPPMADAPATDAVDALLHAFRQDADWSDGRVASFNAALQSLGAQRIAEASAQPEFRSLVEEVRRRFKEQQALASEPLTGESSPLAALALTVGLDLSAPDAAIRIAPPEPQKHASPAASHAHAAAPAESKPVSSPSASAQTVSTTQATSTQAPPRAASAAAGSTTRVASATTPATSSSAATPAAPTDDPCKVSLIGTRRPVCHDTLPTGEGGPDLALVPAGTFEMGSTSAAEEQPVHRASVDKPFAISIYEVSQAEFRLYCERAHASCAAQPWSGDDYPVVNVSWNEARAYAEWLSNATRRRYRLPTEIEWEYAARAGQTGSFPSGETLSPTDAHFSQDARAQTPARRSERFNPNKFRLVHTVGNVREWVQDAWTPDFKAAPVSGVRVARGGSRAEGASRLRLSMREGLPEGTRDVLTGFRVVRDLQ